MTNPDLDRPADPRDTVSQEEIRVLRGIVDNLNTPWWKSSSFYVSAAALILSLVTSIVSGYSAHLKDVHDEQEQLSSVVKEMQSIPERQQEIVDRYKGTPMEFGLTSALTSRSDTLAHEAYDLAIKLGSNAPAAELSYLGEFYFNNSLGFAQTEKLLKLALDQAQDTIVKVGILRQLGFFKVRTGSNADDFAAGDEFFERAIKEASADPDFAKQSFLMNYTNAFTQSGWAETWANVDCKKWAAHLDEAEQTLSRAGMSAAIEQLRRRISVDRASGCNDAKTGQGGLNSPSLPSEAVRPNG
jgi:hypothetical protein